MAFDVKQITVGTSAVQLYSVIVRDVVGWINVRCAPTNTATIWYGPSGVTIATGMPLLPGEKLEIPIVRGTNSKHPDETEYYFISDTAGQIISVHAH